MIDLNGYRFCFNIPAGSPSIVNVISCQDKHSSVTVAIQNTCKVILMIQLQPVASVDMEFFVPLWIS